MKLVFLSGAGISAESGLRTFREMGGLWESYDVMEVASPEGWMRDRSMVLRFYNERRKQLLEALPNEGHYGIAALEEWFDVEVITQNIDDLHERAGSSRVLHLHGELKKSRSTVDPSLVYEIEGWQLNEGDVCEKGSQLRPHVVWFGEAVPAMEEAIFLVQQADIFVIVGTSMAVYPAAGLIHYAEPACRVILIDPNEVPVPGGRKVEFIREKASTGIALLANQLKRNT